MSFVFQKNHKSSSFRNKVLLHLVNKYLADQGFKRTQACLQDEVNLDDEYSVCDNMSLENIIVDFEAYYYLRFQILPQLIKKIVPKTSQKKIRKLDYSQKGEKSNVPSRQMEENLDLTIYPSNFQQAKHLEEPKHATNFIKAKEESRMSISWNHVKGLHKAKEFLKELVIYPKRFPNAYTGDFKGWKSILLYGPPGAGKSMLINAIASESNCNLCKISASSIIDKWRGESEKILQELFETAVSSNEGKSSNIIFIDEIDWLAYKRGELHEHEASRRLKSELFLQIDQLTEYSDNVVFLAATNVPWDLDLAILRRFEKHIYIPLPEISARKEILQSFLVTDGSLVTVDVVKLAQMTEGYSGSDLKNLCKEVKMESIRRTLANNEVDSFHEKNAIKTEDVIETLKTQRRTCSPRVITKYEKWNANCDMQ